MGATLQQDLAINFLDALKNIWSEHPGTYKVDEETEILLRALTQTTIRWLATLARERLERDGENPEVRGRVVYGSTNVQPTDAFRNREAVSLRTALNSIVHGEPQWVLVREGEVIMCWAYTPRWDSTDEGDRPYTAYFMADSLLAEVRRALYSHVDRRGQVLELEQLIRTSPIYGVLIPGATK